MFGRIFHWSVVSDIYASMIAAGITMIVFAVLGMPFDWFPFAGVFFTALAVYALNRQDDQDIDSINVPERTRFVARRGWAVLTFATAGFFSLLTYAYMTNVMAFEIMGGIFLLGLFYSFPLLAPLRGVLGFSRLKDVLGVKNTLVGMMYGAFALMPVFTAGAELSPLAWLLFIFVSIRFFIISTVFDLRDVEGDRRKGVNTIPAIFGRETAMLFLHGLNLVSLLIVAAGAHWGFVPALFGAMALVTFLYGAYYIEETKRENADLRHLCGVVVEADYLPAAAMALAFMVWPLL